ncbi:MAG: hypothetical protein GY868_00540, partial [Deltaproteobacteria bacterium]|nr:hypothetical protein [Deltaproteobacteria bacterium]
TDDDGDGITDCLDQDCWGEDPCMVKITTDTLPSGTLNSSYATTLAATDGMLPYAWSLTGNGGFVTDLVLNASTGQLSGTLDQCPGTYTIGVKVTDSTPAAANGPTSDTKSLDLTVTSDLAVSRISGDGSAVITWSDKDQSESFRAAGERIGAVTWSLNAGGATGFTTASAADDTGSIIKNGITTAGTYTFTLTATDASCPGNTAQIELTVTVTAGGTPAPNPPGTILAEVDTLEFDTDDGGNPDIIHISGDVYAIAYTGASSDGWLKTVSISSDGTISSTIVDSYEFDTSRGEEPAIINVSGDTYAIAYRGNLSDGWLRTLDISAAGAISAIGGSDSHEFDSDDGDTPDILNVSGDIFAIVHRGNSNDGWLRTVDISAAGVISAVGGSDVYEYDISDGYDPDIIHIVNDIFAVAYRGDRDDGWMKTVQVSSSGVITPADVDSFEFDTDTGYEPCLLHKSGDIYIVAYRGDAYDGWLRSLDISSAGSISAVGGSDTYEFDASDGYEPVIVQVSGDIYAVAYRGPDDDGWLKTVNISDSGAITQSTISSYEFDANEANLPDMVHVSGNVFAIAYEGLDGVGWLKTVTIKQ